MKMPSNKETTYTLTGMILGAVAFVGIRHGVGIFFEVLTDSSTLYSYGATGMLVGAYFGYILSNLYDFDFKIVVGMKVKADRFFKSLELFNQRTEADKARPVMREAAQG